MIYALRALLCVCPAVVHHHKDDFLHQHYDNRADESLLCLAYALHPPLDTSPSLSPFLRVIPAKPVWLLGSRTGLRHVCLLSAVVRYHKGEFYHEHYDNRADGPLTRAATILVYLCDTEEGGATR